MKKTLLLTIGLFFALILSGCGKDEPVSLEDRINQNTNQETVLSYEGIIESIDLSIHQQGTHQINMGDQTLLIQSSKFNLNNYLNKKVEVSGSKAPKLGNAKDVLNVIEIRTLETDLGELSDYESETNYFKLSFPIAWDLEKGAKELNFDFDEQRVGSIVIFDNVQDMETFAENREGKAGTPVTAAHQAALRYNDVNSFRVYIPHEPVDKVIMASFNQEAFKDKKTREAAYELIRSIELTYKPKTLTGPACGGPENLQCPQEGGMAMVCQLDKIVSLPEESPENEESVEETGEPETAQIPTGICVPKQTGSCPLLSPPLCEGNEAYVSQYNQSGCPSAFSCPAPEQSSLELTPEELMEIPEEIPDSTEEGSNDMEEENELEESEENNQNNDTEEEEASEETDSEEKDYNIPPVSSITSTFEVRQKNFSFNHPKSWYFSHLPNTQGTEWLIGLSSEQLWSDEEDASLEKAVITLSVIDKDENGLKAGYTATKNRDEETEYRVQGPSELKAVIEAITDSIQNLE